MRTPQEQFALRVLLFLGVPLVLVMSFSAIELSMAEDDHIHISLQGSLNEVLKHTLDLNAELAKLFIGLATAVIGGVAYYIKSRAAEFSDLTPFSKALLTSTLIAAVISIFFGHLWYEGMRNQLAHDYIDYTQPAIRWSERLQYLFFLTSLIWFGLLVIDREQARLPRPQDGTAAQTTRQLEASTPVAADEAQSTRSSATEQSPMLE